MRIDDRCALVLVIRHLPNPNGLVPAGCGQQLTTGRPTDALDFVLVALQSGVALELARLFVPNGQGRVETRGCNVIVTWGPRDFANRPRVTLGQDGLEGPLGGRAFGQPDPYGLVLAARGEASAFRVPTDVPNSSPVSAETLMQLQSAHCCLKTHVEVEDLGH